MKRYEKYVLLLVSLLILSKFTPLVRDLYLARTYGPPDLIPHHIAGTLAVHLDVDDRLGERWRCCMANRRERESGCQSMDLGTIWSSLWAHWRLNGYVFFIVAGRPAWHMMNPDILRYWSDVGHYYSKGNL